MLLSDGVQDSFLLPLLSYRGVPTMFLTTLQNKPPLLLFSMVTQSTTFFNSSFRSCPSNVYSINSPPMTLRGVSLYRLVFSFFLNLFHCPIACNFRGIPFPFFLYPKISPTYYWIFFFHLSMSVCIVMTERLKCLPRSQIIAPLTPLFSLAYLFDGPLERLCVSFLMWFQFNSAYPLFEDLDADWIFRAWVEELE